MRINSALVFGSKHAFPLCMVKRASLYSACSLRDHAWLPRVRHMAGHWVAGAPRPRAPRTRVTSSACTTAPRSAAHTLMAPSRLPDTWQPNGRSHIGTLQHMGRRLAVTWMQANHHDKAHAADAQASMLAWP